MGPIRKIKGEKAVQRLIGILALVVVLVALASWVGETAHAGCCETATPTATTVMTSTVTATPTSTVVVPNVSYTLEAIPGNRITMSLGSAYSIQALLKRDGEVITNQLEFSYNWEASDWTTAPAMPFDACTNGMVLPCPYDHARILGLKAGEASVWVDVFRYTGTGTRTLVARKVFQVVVQERPGTVTPTPTSTPVAIPTIPPLPDVTSVTLGTGWNNIALPFSGVAYTADSLLDELSRQGISAMMVVRWNNGGWDSHVGGFPANNFAVEPGHGYFVRVIQPGTWYPGWRP